MPYRAVIFDRKEVRLQMTGNLSTKKNAAPFCLLIMIQNILYGFGDPISKAAYEVMPVYSLLAVRYFIALVLFIFIGRRNILRGLKQCKPKVWLLPSVCIAGCYVLSNVALELTAATSVAFLRSLTTVMTPILAFFAYRTKYQKYHIPIQAMIVVGLYLLCGKGGLAGFGLGEVLTLLSAFLMAGALVFGGKALEEMDAVTLSTVQTAACVVMAVVCSFVFDGGIQVKDATGQTWTVICYLGICCTLAGYLLQNVALEKIPSRVVALIQCLCPVMTAVFSFILLGEKMSVYGVVGALILLVCVMAEILMEKD